jgi:hypothetical protein
MILLTLVFAFAVGVCNPNNASDSPFTTGCVFCDLSTQSGCNGGTCYLQPVAINISIPYCSCPYGLAPPQCATTAPVLPICANGTSPPSCQFCVPGTNEGCSNDGVCYLHPVSGPGIPPNTSIPVCKKFAVCVFFVSFFFVQGGCAYYFAPPQCTVASVPAPLCNISNPSIKPPFCEYCRLGLEGFPTMANGCSNFGSCTLRNVSGAGVPPNFQVFQTKK